MTTKDLTDIILEIVTSFVTKPEAVTVTHTKTGVLNDIRITPHDDDVGRVIGVKGSRWKALAAVCHAFGLKENMRVELLKVPEPLAPKKDFYPPFEEKDDYPRDKLKAMAWALGRICFRDEGAVSVELIDKGAETTLLVNVASSERHGAVLALSTAFYCLFEAIGMSMGRKVRTAIVPEVVEQPATAAGRHAAETENQ